MATDMETDGGEKYALSVYSLLKTTQGQHGLKHGDFLRYRKYTSRRLLRLYKSLKHHHGKKEFVKPELLPEHVKEERHFLIPLMQAERSWAQAMEIKKELDSKKARGNGRGKVRKRERDKTWPRQ